MIKDIDDLPELPKGWEMITLGDVLQLNYGKSLTKLNRNGGQYAVYGSNGIVGFHSNFLVNNPCLIVGRKGSIGEINISENPCYPIDTTYYINAFYEQPINFWFYRLKALPLGQLNRASAVPGLNREDAYQLPIHLPPLNEQRRIVAKIEVLKARSQRVKEALEDIPQLLDQFRQSVLAAAFRGDLTADWREQNSNVEPAEVLLERIRAERRCRWEEAELEKMKVSGKLPKDDKWKSKYKESEIKIFEDLSDIPSSWAWGTLDLVCSNIVDCPHETAQYTEDGMIIVRTSDFRIGELDLSQTRFVSKETFDKRVKRLKPVKDDILYSREGGIFGIACPVPDVEICMGQRMMLLRVDKNIYDSQLLMWIMNSPQVFAQAKSKVIGTASPHVNVADIKRFYLSSPPLIEQREIIKRINIFFQTIKTLRLELLFVTEKIGNLDQSILAKAFRGELVPQDPNDEPASVLLERIRAERAKLQTKTAKKSTTKTSARRTQKTQPQQEESVQLDLGLE